jgi:hypothetical protein
LTFGQPDLAALDEPVRRYLTHTMGDAGHAPAAVRLVMDGRINVGRWLAFDAVQEFHGHEFVWSARAGWRAVKPLHVVDAYRDGRGRTTGRVFGHVPFLRADDENTTRAAAGRAAVESIWVPGSLLPGGDVTWQALSADTIVACVPVPPEHPQVTLKIDATGAVRSVSVMRWGNVGREDFGYIPFGGHVHAEQRFGDLVLPSAVTVGWWFGTPRFRPFFEATIREAAPIH